MSYGKKLKFMFPPNEARLQAFINSAGHCPAFLAYTSIQALPGFIFTSIRPVGRCPTLLIHKAFSLRLTYMRCNLVRTGMYVLISDIPYFQTVPLAANEETHQSRPYFLIQGYSHEKRLPLFGTAQLLTKIFNKVIKNPGMRPGLFFAKFKI